MNEKLGRLNRRLDELALQKRLEIEAEHLKRITCTKFIRLFGTFTGSEFHVNTRILNEMGAEDRTGFWNLVKRVCLCVNTEFGSGGAGPGTDEREIYEWTEASEAEGFTIPLNGRPGAIQILLKLKNQRNVQRLSPGLAALLNKATDTKYSVVKDLYKYVNANKLNDYSSSNVSCDKALQKIFGVSRFNFNSIYELVEAQLHPIFYCVVDVKEGGIWDVEVEIDDLSQMPVLYPKYVEQLEKKIEETANMRRRVAERIATLEEFNADPAHYINRKIALESDGIGTRSVFYDDLAVQSVLYELIKKKE